MIMAVGNLTCVGSGLDRTCTTFGEQGKMCAFSQEDIDAIKRSKNADGCYVSGYKHGLKFKYPYAVAKIGFGAKKTNARPYKLEYNHSRMSDDDLWALVRLLRSIFGEEVAGSIWHSGKLSAVEFHADFSGIDAGVIIPVNKSKAWSVWGAGDDIESHYWGKKLYKSYMKQAWYKSNRFLSQISNPEDFEPPAEKIARLERTVQSFPGVKKGDSMSFARLLEQGFSPFGASEFIDVRELMGNPHIGEMEIFYLTCKGVPEFLNACERKYNSVQFGLINSLIQSARRDGIDPEVDLSMRGSIERLRMFSPDFKLADFKNNTHKCLRGYHHLGFVTRELLDLIGFEYMPYENKAPINVRVKKLLRETYGSASLQDIKGKLITEAVARKLILLASDK